MSTIQTIDIGSVANDGTGDSLRDAGAKINTNFTNINYKQDTVMTGPNLIVIGDSISAQNTGGSGSGSGNTLRSAYHSSEGYIVWMLIRMGFPFHFPVGYDQAVDSAPRGHNAAIGGQTTTQMLARFTTDVLDKNPDLLVVHAGTNDITGGATYATITSNLQSMYEQAIAKGATVCAIPILPRNADGGSNWANNDQRLLHLRVNEWIRQYCLTKRGMILADPTPYITDMTTGDMITGYTQGDGVHPRIIAAYWIAQALIDVLTQWYGSRRTTWWNPDDIYEATKNPQGNVLTNGELQGTSGTNGSGCSGSVATSWTIERSSGSTITCVNSKTSKTKGANAITQQQLVISAGGSGTNSETIRFRPTTFTVTNGVAADVWYEGECEIEVSAPSVNGLIASIYMQAQDQVTNGQIVRCGQKITGYTYPDVAWSGVFKTPPMKSGGTTGIRLNLAIDIDGTKTGNVTIKVNNISLRRIQWTPPFDYA